MQSVKAQFEERGVEIVVVSFAKPERLVYYQQVHQWPFTLLADPDRNAYKYLGLGRLPWYRVFSFSTIRMYLKLLREGRTIQSYGKDDYYQAGGDFLINYDGKVLFAHRSHDPADRPSGAKLLEAIDLVRGQTC